MNKKRILFIVNPKSGIGKHDAIDEVVANELDHSLAEPEIVWTEKPGHAHDLSIEAVSRGIDIVVAVGGDGSVNECGSALVHSNTALAIVPCGSGNGLARHLGIPMDIIKSIQLLNNCAVRTIDTASLNGRAYMGVSGVGFDAHIGKVFDKFGKRGFLSYVRLALREYRSYIPRNFVVEMDDETLTTNALLIAVANSSQFGNNARITPMAVDNDGKLDVAIIEKFPMINGFGIARKLFGGKLEKSSYTTYRQASRVKISQPDSLAHIDGEPFEAGKKLEYEIKPLSLNVAVPLS